MASRHDHSDGSPRHQPDTTPRHGAPVPVNERWYGELEARVKHLEAEVVRLREWRHDVPSELIAPLQNQIQDVMDAVQRIPQEVRDLVPKMTTTTTTTKTQSAETGEDRHLTMRDFYIAVGALIAGIAIAVRFF